MNIFSRFGRRLLFAMQPLFSRLSVQCKLFLNLNLNTLLGRRLNKSGLGLGDICKSGDFCSSVSLALFAHKIIMLYRKLSQVQLLIVCIVQGTSTIHL